MSNQSQTSAVTKTSGQRKHLNQEIAGAIEHESVITIMASAAKIYQFWRDLNNLPRFMKKLESIEIKGKKLSHWKWKALLDQVAVEWDSEIIMDTPDTLIAWRSREGSTVAHTGEVSFTELAHGRGTEVRVILDYHPPGGAVTDFLGKIIGESPTRVMQDDLRRLRDLMEVGIIATVEGQSRGGMDETINPKLHTKH